MKEDWLKDIHDKMAGYEADEPHGLWDGIRREGLPGQQPERASRRRSVLWLWTKRVAAAAAMVASVFSVLHFAKDGRELPSPVLTVADVKVAGTGGGRHIAALPEGAGEEPAAPVEHARFGAPEAAGQAAEAVQNVRASAEVAADTIPIAGQDKDIPGTGRQETAGTSRQRNEKSGRGIYPGGQIARAGIDTEGESGRLSCGVFVTGGAGSELNRRTTGAVAAGLGPDGADWDDSPLLGILLYNQGREVKASMKHHLPVRAGVSFVCKINGRVSLQSGLTYTHLTSEMREGSASHYFTGEQTLHYVGIPLGLKCRILSWKGLELYASSGLFAEKCVSGKQKREYVLNGKVGKKETQDLNEKPFQWSVNASAGLQYDISPSIGIYAEPGVSYYFDDGTSVKTIYKDKPFNFSLNFGLRFTFGNK